MVDSAGSLGNSGSSFREQRTVPRYGLMAVCEVIEPASDLRFSCRISEISLKGCYVDILNPMPIATVIDLHVSRDRGAFTARGRVIYSQQGMGMGVAFLDVAAEQLKTLQSWLEELGAA
jgi:PilZ domain